MSDITICSTTDCPLQNRCYRKRAAPNPDRQSTARFEWVAVGTQVACEHHLPIWRTRATDKTNIDPGSGEANDGR